MKINFNIGELNISTTSRNKIYNIGEVTTTVNDLLDETTIEVFDNFIPIISLIDNGDTKRYLLPDFDYNYGPLPERLDLPITESDLISISSGSGGDVPTLNEVLLQGNSSDKDIFLIDNSIELSGLSDDYKNVLTHSNINLRKDLSGEQSTLDPFKFVIQVDGFGEWMEYNKNAIVHYNPDTEVNTKLDFDSDTILNKTYTFDPDKDGVLGLRDYSIPITGTEIENPVTGDIEMSDNNKIFFDNSVDYNAIRLSEISAHLESYSYDNNDTSSLDVGQEGDIRTVVAIATNSDETEESILRVNPTGIEVSSIGSTSKGISGVQDFTSNITDLDYVQKKYVDAQKPYKVYSALVSQELTNDPTAIVLENTLGGTVIWSRSGAGEYIATLTGAFTLDKTMIFLGPIYEDAVTPALITANRIDDNTITLSPMTISGANDDNLLINASVEFRVYN